MIETSITNYEDFQNSILDILNKRNMTQTELARLSNLTPGGISRIVNGNRTSLKTMTKIANVLGYNLKITLEKIDENEVK